MRRVSKNKKSNCISFTTPDKERKERLGEAIELYKAYMLDLEKGKSDEKTEVSEKFNRAVEDNTLTRGKEKKVSGEHSSSGKRVYGVRRRTRKSEDAERVSEESEEYPSTTRYGT